jgi:primosomal protein N' (replication factor Y)
MDAPDVASPIAVVVLDVRMPHLDREYEYTVPASLAAEAVPGARIRARFAGRLVDGFVVRRSDAPTYEGALSPLHKVVSAEPVYTPEVHRLLRATADRYGGTLADLLRFAVPPRHAGTEKADPPAPSPPAVAEPATCALDDYPTGRAYLDALRGGLSPRAAWQVAPVASPLGDPFRAMVEAARATLASGRGAILVVPHQRDLDRLVQAATELCGANTFAVLSAELGPSVRYRHFLTLARGTKRLVLGTRSAVYAPVRDLGLIGIWDDDSGDYAEAHSPYPHAREVAAIRVVLEGAGLLVAARARSLEVQLWAESDWVRDIAIRPAELRAATPAIRIAATTDLALEQDPYARSARLPHDVFATVRTGLASGPVLVHVPFTGYVRGVVCRECGRQAECPGCGTPLRGEPGPEGLTLHCPKCGPRHRWTCPSCHRSRVRASSIGVARTAEELGRAFPGIRVITSWGDRIVDEVTDDVALVVATPGAEPPAAHGYAAAVLLDTTPVLNRIELRTPVESLRRWLAAVALVRPAAEGGTVVVVGPGTSMVLQALVRADPIGFADRVLAERREARLSPAVRMVTIDGAAPAIEEFEQVFRLPERAERVALAALPPTATAQGVRDTGRDLELRLTLRAPLDHGKELVSEVKAATAIRSARKDRGGPTRVKVDPRDLG